MNSPDRGVSRDLEWFNALSADKAIRELIQCCGSAVWAQSMNELRPFATGEQLTLEARKVWRKLTRQDWLEAFRSHPKIGEREAAQQTSARAQTWSSEEQKASASNKAETKHELRRLNLEYEAKFGFIFIICATGKSAGEILDALRRRLKNDEPREIREAADEQEKITELRLQKLLVDQQ